MQHYELLCIISSLVSEEDFPLVKEKILKLIQSAGGEVTREELIGKRRLAFRIKQHRFGTYFLIELNLPPEKLSALERELRLTEEVVRHQALKARVKSERELLEERLRRERFAYEAPRERKVPERAVRRPAAKPEEKKVSLKELDEKLDEILEDDMLKNE